MASSKYHRKHPHAFRAALLVLMGWPLGALAQQPSGYSVERFYPSAPGGGWFVMDEVNMSGGLGAAVSLTTGYSRNALVVSSPGSASLALISNQAVADVGVAVTYDRYRLYLNLPVPLLVSGNSGSVGPYQLTAPSMNIATNPDTIADSRLGFDARLLGKPGSALRLGGGAQFIFPSGDRANYISDGRYRGMFRLLPAGDIGRFSYAGQFGVHVRPAEGLPLPGSPNGNELLFGFAAGDKFSLRKEWSLTVGPELFGAAAVHSSSNGQTAFEGLLTARFEHNTDRAHLRLRFGIGHSIVQNFGAPQWRMLVGMELIGPRPKT